FNKIKRSKTHLTLIQITSKFEFTNVKCKSLDRTFCAIEYCYIKPINRTYKYVSLRGNIFQRNLTKIKMNFSISKRGNGYRPFLYNFTIDACRFLKNTSSHPIAEFFYKILKPHSNLNHSCPYDHDFIIDKFPIGYINHQLTHVLPFPEGEYLFETYWYAYDISRAYLAFYGTLS
ncbi:hypothetical protein KR054_007013, partial [Drosophila jambulina]